METQNKSSERWGLFYLPWLKAEYIQVCVNKGKVPDPIKGTGKEYNFVGHIWQRDLRALSSLYAYEILAEINKDFFDGKGHIGYKFGTSQSGFELETWDPQIPQVFLGVIKDANKFVAGDNPSLGIGIGFQLSGDQSPAQYLSRTQANGLVVPNSPDPNAIFHGTLVSFVNAIRVVRNPQQLPIQGYAPYNTFSPPLEAPPVIGVPDERAQIAAYLQHQRPNGIVLPGDIDARIAAERGSALAPLHQQLGFQRMIDPFGVKFPPTPGAPGPFGGPIILPPGRGI